MKLQRLLVILTALNFTLLGYQIVFLHPRVATAAADVPEVVQARSLQIVDEQGRVRASIAVHPENPAVLWQGKPYPDTVLFRMMSPEGRPNVKLSASQQGSGLVIGGEANPTHIQVLAQGGATTVKLINQDGAERVVTP